MASAAAARLNRRIRAEHIALSRVIAAMQLWVVAAREPGVACDAEVFDAMLLYVVEVPDRIHHPREDTLLFPAVAGLPGGAALVAELEAEHAAGAALLGAVRDAHHAMWRREPNALNRLSTAVDEFAEFYWAHMRKEEEVLLPLANALLGEAEWERIERGFEAVNDPLFTSAPAAAYRRLYRCIAERSPESLRGFLEEAAAR